MRFKHSRFAQVATVALLAGTVAACGDDNNPVDPSRPQPGNATITGTISANRTLYADTTYTLQGTVLVPAGVTLTVQPGTTILGDANTPTTFLLVRPGGKLMADGTADRPIVFTSSRAAGSRQRGDWGGVVLVGSAPANCSNCQGEGPVGSYGGTNPDDNSGVLRYVRIEYVGQVFTADNELNGLTLYGVGRGTTIDHVQVHYGLDDGIELFGGTVNIKYALVTGAEDDSFDYSTGWSGKGQFWLAQQDPNIGDKGFEVDGNEDSYAAQPYTNPQIYNFTLVGKGPAGNAASTVSPDALHLRRGTAGKVYNGVVVGWANGLDIDDQDTVNRCQEGMMTVSNVLFTDISGELYEPEVSKPDEFEAACLGQPATHQLSSVAGPLLVAPYERATPNFQPVAGSAVLTAQVAAPPTDGFFSPVNYLGAVAPTGTPWYTGWTTFAAN